MTKLINKWLKRFDVGTAHPITIGLLLLMCFLESFILPFSPLFLLVPMVFAHPDRAWRYTLYATVAATIGAIIGYLIGFYLIDYAMPYVIHWGYEDSYWQAVNWFSRWGAWMLLVSSIFPLPFKFFTWISGSAHFPFIPFIIIVILVRALHFALVPIAHRFFKTVLIRWQTAQDREK